MTTHFRGLWDKAGYPALPITSRARASTSLLIIAAILLAVAANAFAAVYVSAEHYIYYWDWSMYWNGFWQLGEMFRHDVFVAIKQVSLSIRTDDYNLLPILPLVPFEIIGGAGRTSYILAITNMGVLPGAALMALVPARMAEHRSWPRYLLCTAVLLGLHPLWAPALRGMPDVVGLVIACAILLTYFSKSVEEKSPSDSIRLGILLCLLILTRRWYIFWAASFFPAAVAAYLAAPPRRVIDRSGIVSLARALALAGITCLAFLLILAAPLVARVAVTDYTVAFAAYQSNLGSAGQVIAQFGLALLSVAVAGLAWLVVNQRTRALGILLIVQAVLSLALFTRVQGFFGVQHYYLLVPAAGIGIAGAVIALWHLPRHWIWRATGIATICATVLISSLTVFSPKPVISSALLPRVSYPPLVRTDIRQIDRLLGALKQLKPKEVYVAASSEVLNWSVLVMACREMHSGPCPSITVTHDIDTRDGFPSELAETDYVVLATPTQYHVRPEDQRVVGLVARDIRSGRGIGSSFEPLPGQFHLEHGVEAQIYRRTAPVRQEDLNALGDELARSYPRIGIVEYWGR